MEAKPKEIHIVEALYVLHNDGDIALAVEYLKDGTLNLINIHRGEAKTAEGFKQHYFIDDGLVAYLQQRAGCYTYSGWMEHWLAGARSELARYKKYGDKVRTA